MTILAKMASQGNGALACGFARDSITPSFDVPLDGMGENDRRVPNRVTEDILATMIALSDGVVTVLIGTLDVLWIPGLFYEEAAGLIGMATGIPMDRIFLCATHTHAAPDIRTREDGRVQSYTSFLCLKMEKLAVAAIQDLTVCSLSYGKTVTKDLNAVRRYFMENGKLYSIGVTDIFGKVCPETAGDPSVQVICVKRPGKKDIVLVNYAAHPSCGADLHAVHPSYIGALRRYAEKKDRLIAFFQGAQGNMGFCASNGPEGRKIGYEEAGLRLGGYVEDILPNLRTLTEPEHLKLRRRKVPGRVDHRHDDLLPVCRELLETYSGNTPFPEEITREYGLYAATELYKIEQTAGELKGRDTLDIPCGVLTVGDAAFVFAGVEMFAQTGMLIKAVAPYPIVFICGNSCDSKGYLPAAECYVNHGFEVNSTVFLPGTAEQLADGVIEMLYEVSNEQGKA